MYDLIIVGGGPAGMAAGICAGRKKLKTLLIADGFGGQPIIAGEIHNFVGIKSISGLALAKMLEEHLRSQEGIEIKDNSSVVKIEKRDAQFIVIADNGKNFEAETVLLALGSHYRKLNIPGEAQFKGRGVFYCSICDAPLMKNKTVAVIGGGNSGFGIANDLLPYSSKIYLLEETDTLLADQIIQEKIKNSGKVEIITMATGQEIYGDEFIKGIKYRDGRTEEIKDLAIEGIFVAIGYQPNSEIVENLVEINEVRGIIVDHKTQKTSCDGIWAAGDVTDGLYHQINIAIGDAIKAVLNICEYLKNK